MVRVLVVDDDPDVLSVIEEMLSARGFAATGSGSADRARIRLSAKHFDVVVVAPMPGLSGIDLARDVREVGTPVLMIPAGADALPRIEGAGLPFLLKPFRAEELVGAVHLVLRDIREPGPA